VKILALTNLYPPQHAGTYDFRCQNTVEALKLRGHTVRVLTSKHGMHHEQRGGEVERRLLLNGAFEHPHVTRFSELRPLERENHRILRETIEAFQPDLIHVFSLMGLGKSLLFTLQNGRRPAVFDVADFWLSKGLRVDPWLRWWNRPDPGFGDGLWRAVLELCGVRNKLDREAPTRLARGYDRVPQVYGEGEQLASVEPNSIAAFRFDRLYFCSQALKSATVEAGFRVRHAEVIYPGIPAQNFVNEIKPPTAPLARFLIVARLDAQSGVLTAVKALGRLRAAGHQAGLSVCGRGDSDYIAQVRSHAAMHQLPVEFIPGSNLAKELPAIYRRHDALLHTAEWNEPYSLTPLEAMASGLPVIATQIGGVQELVRHGENALTYPPGDADELAARMQELQLQPELRCKLADNAQQEVLARYNETAVMDRLEDFLQASLEAWAQTGA
jgi:glycosyltransferase involved in cell wall biosynthesis